MSTEPLVSIILPTYNRASLIKRAIDSILLQTYRNFELIIIDDGSTDGTERIVSGFSDKRIIYKQLDGNFGANNARNIGISISQGEYIAFQDSDDIWLAEKLRLQVEMLVSSVKEIGVVYVKYFTITRGKYSYFPRKKWINNDDAIFNRLLTHGNFIDLPTTLIRKECFRKAGDFDASLPRFQDWDLMLRIAKLYRFVYISKPLLQSNITKESISTNINNIIVSLNIILKKYSDDFEKFPEAKANQYYYYGKTLCVIGKKREAKEYLLSALGIKFQFRILIILFLCTILNSKILSKILHFSEEVGS